MSTKNNSTDKVPVLQKMCYTCGDLGVNLMHNIISSYFMLFMTNIMGIAPVIGGVIFAIARIWDAINDPLMGSISERVKPRKLGRYRSWMAFAIVPYAVFFVLCFTNPELSMGAKIVYIGCIYICYGMSATMFQVPYGSLASVMTTNTQQYSILGVFRDYGANIAGTVVSLTAVILITHFGGDMNTQEGFTRTAILVGVVAVLFMCLAVFGTKERVQTTVEPTKLKDCMKAFTKNRPSQILCGVVFFFSLGNAFRLVWTPYYCMYYLGDANVISTILSIMFAIPLGMLLLVPFLTKKFGKKTVLAFGNIFLAGSGIFFMFAKDSYFLIILASIFCGLSLGMAFSVIWGMLPDTVNYGEWKTGIRASGFIYAIGVFAVKLGSAVANFGAGTYLSILGYDASLGMNQLPEVQEGINLANGLTAIFFGVCALIILSFYKLDKNTCDKIEVELADMRAAKIK